MALETASYIANLVATNPDGADQRNTADDHIRLTKAVLKRSLPLIDGAVSLSQTQLMFLNDVSRSVQFQINALRDGSATANNAIFANSASLARRALALFDEVNSVSYSVSDFRRFNDLSFSLVALVATSPQVRYIDTNASDSFSNAILLYSGRVFSLRFYDSQFSVNKAVIGVVREDSLGSVEASQITLNAGLISLSSTTVTMSGNLIVGGVATSNAAYLTAGVLDDDRVQYSNVAQHAHSLSVAVAGFANTAGSASNAALLGGLPAFVGIAGESISGNTVVVRNAAGYIFAQYFNQDSAVEDESIGHLVYIQSNDGYFRKSSIANAGLYMETRNISGRTGTRKNLLAGTGPPTLSAGSQNGEMWFYY